MAQACLPCLSLFASLCQDPVHKLKKLSSITWGGGVLSVQCHLWGFERQCWHYLWSHSIADKAFLTFWLVSDFHYSSKGNQEKSKHTIVLDLARRLSVLPPISYLEGIFGPRPVVPPNLVRFSNWLHRVGWGTWLPPTQPNPPKPIWTQSTKTSQFQVK